MTAPLSQCMGRSAVIALTVAASLHATPLGHTAGDATVLAPPPTSPGIPRILAIPVAPWTHAVRWTLPSPAAGPVVGTPDGYAVSLSSPESVAFLSPHGDLRATAALRGLAPPSLVPVADGAVLAVDDMGRVIAVAPDGTTRANNSIASSINNTALVRTDGTVVLVGPSPPGTAVTLVSQVGDPIASTVTPGVSVANAIRLGDDAALVATQSPALVRYDLMGAFTRTPFVPDVTALAALDDGRVAAVAGTEVLLVTSDGGIRARADLGDRLGWITPLPDGGVAVLRTTQPEAMVLIDHDASVRARVPCPLDTAPPLVDSAGAMLLVARSGVVLAVAPDGTVLWRIVVHTRLIPPAVGLPGGGVLVATTGHELLALY